MSAADNVNVKSYTWTRLPTVLSPPSGDLPSVPVTVKEVSPINPGVTVSVEVTPAKVGVTDEDENEPVTPLSVRLVDGMLPVEPVTRVDPMV